MPYGKYTVTYDVGGVQYKICKIWFGRDGSYYVTSPYHPEGKAIILKATVDYSLSQMEIPHEELVDTAAVDDDDHRLKLAHHRDGFVQFSGHGILSGRAVDGTAKGMGVRSWPLTRPVRGPAFGIVVRGVERFAVATEHSGGRVRFSSASLIGVERANTIYLEGHYFPGALRRFVQPDHDGDASISVVHPASAIVSLKAIFPDSGCELDGFLGLTLFGDRVPEEFAEGPFFALSGPTGNLRRALDGRPIAESLHCMYPRSDLDFRRVLNYDAAADELSSDPERRGRP